MAEFLGQDKRPSNQITQDGLNAMGHPIPMFRRQNAYDDCKAMGMAGPVDITACVGAVAEALERDEPYRAMSEATRYLDLTGAYRLLAVLLTSPDPEFARQPDAPYMEVVGTGRFSSKNPKTSQAPKRGPTDTDDRMEQYTDYA